MKRFYNSVAVLPEGAGWGVQLDGRPVNTPGRARLAVPSEALANAIAEEWRAQGDKIDPRSMPFTGLANAAIDRVAPDRDAFGAGLTRYAESDLLCYRAEGPASLVERQAKVWDRMLAWARRRYDVDLETVCGIIHRPQSPNTLAQLSQAVAARSHFELAALSPIVTITGSLVIALAVAEEAVTPDEAWDAAVLDEVWQAEQWGEDAEALKVREGRRREFDAAVRFLRLLG